MRVDMRKCLWLLLKIALCLVGLIVVYVLIGTILSLIPVNGKVVRGNDVAIYLENNGVHTDIVVPTRTERFDWSTVVPPGNTLAKTAGAYLAFGWGSQEFYLNVPDWKDLTLGIALKAISGLGGTALHATYKSEPIMDADCRRLMLTSAQYDSLVQYILSSGKRNEQGAFIYIDYRGYNSSDAFYEGTGRYSPFFTCNTWANSALKSCEQKCCLWTAMMQPIFWKYRQKQYKWGEEQKGAADVVSKDNPAGCRGR